MSTQPTTSTPAVSHTIPRKFLASQTTPGSYSQNPTLQEGYHPADSPLSLTCHAQMQWRQNSRGSKQWSYVKQRNNTRSYSEINKRTEYRETLTKEPIRDTSAKLHHKPMQNI